MLRAFPGTRRGSSCATKAPGSSRRTPTPSGRTPGGCHGYCGSPSTSSVWTWPCVFDFLVSDPLHHYMEAGMLTGIKARAEGRCSHASNADAAAAAVEPAAAATN